MSTARLGRWTAALGIALAVAGCVPAEPAPPPELGTEFTLAVGDTAVLEAGRVTVLLSDVTDDGRCPEGAMCVWEGDAVVHIETTVAGRQSAHELHANPQFPTEAHTDGYRIALRSIQPPGSAGEIPLAEYRVNLLVTRE
ncbi:hypothetical protein ACFWPH_19770 [Nocardia sp. NPDC058499]|uniref:hypothetical protein n=1 Tax=Nocardia sp. NPDC058499 TaxID=3346530 RepID=UPI003666D3E9